MPSLGGLHAGLCPGARLSRLLSAAGRGAEAVRHNAKPFLLVQGVALLLALSYYMVPGAPEALAGVARFKRAGGVGFAALSTAFAGAVLPEVARLATGRKRTGAAEMAFQLVFFGFLGVTVDLLYLGLGAVFGNDPSAATIGKKLLVDQFLYCPFVSMPISTVAFVWKDSGFSVARTRNAFRAHGGFLPRYLPLLVTCWGYWAPVLIAIYAMPGDLQFPLFLAVQAAWSLLLLHLNDR